MTEASSKQAIAALKAAPQIACLRVQLELVGRQLLKADAADARGRACGHGVDGGGLSKRVTTYNKSQLWCYALGAGAARVPLVHAVHGMHVAGPLTSEAGADDIRAQAQGLKDLVGLSEKNKD